MFHGSVRIRIPHIKLPPVIAAVVDATQALAAGVPVRRVIHQDRFGVESRVDHHRLAKPALRPGSWADRFVVMPAASCAEGCCNWWWVVRIGRNSPASKETSLAHRARVTSYASLVFLLSLLLLPPSPQQEKDTSNNGCNSSNATDNTSDNSTGVIGAFASGLRLRCILCRLIDDGPRNNGTAFGDDLNTRRRLSCNRGNDGPEGGGRAVGRFRLDAILAYIDVAEY